MGWARYAQTIRIFVLNSGLFYIQPSNRTVCVSQCCARVCGLLLSSLIIITLQRAVQVNLMDRINEYLKYNKAWDQTVR